MTRDEVPSKPLALALLTTAQFMIVLDASIVNVALPSIQHDLHFSSANLSWIVNVYLLMLGGFLLLGGRLADLIGRRRVFIVGMTLFAIGSLLGGLSATELQLIACRATQGLGAALVFPAALSMVSVIFTEGKERNRAFGVWGAVAGSAAAIGVVLSGVITQLLGWEWIFFINVPVALGAAMLAPRLLIESRQPGHKSYDVPGAMTLTSGLLAIVYAIVDANSAGWGSLQTIGLLAAGAALLALFILIEMRTAEPLITFSIFRLPTLRAANIYALVNNTCVIAVFYVSTIFMQQVFGYSALRTGIALMPISILTIVCAGIASNVSTRVGAKSVLVVGTAFEVVGLLWFSQLSADGSYWSEVLAPSLVLGVGLGLGFVAITIAALTGTDRTNAGLGSGLINTNQQIGRAIGIAILISVFTSKVTDEVSHGTSRAVALSDGLGSGLLVLAGICFASLLLAIFMLPSAASLARAEAN